MSDHIPDITKMISDTPRTDNYDWSFHLLFAEAQKMERELNAANERIKNLESALSTVENIDKVNAYQDLESANERIKRLIAERDTARLQSDRNYKLREEFRELLGTDDVEQGVAVVREMKERIKRLEEELERTKQDRNAIAKKTREPLLLKLDHANERISKLNDYVAALETGGDLMANELSFGYDVDLWNKARGEAKP